jgi:hypothetical protein
MEKLKAKEFHSLIADGTGFGYSDTFKLLWMKGKEIRQVRTHIKTGVLVGVVRDKAVVVGVNTGEAYSDEGKLLEPVLRALEFRAKYFLGDAYYGSVKVLREVKQLNMVAVVPVKDTVRKKARDPYRLWQRRTMKVGGRFIRRTGLGIGTVLGIIMWRVCMFLLYSLSCVSFSVLLFVVAQPFEVCTVIP